MRYLKVLAVSAVVALIVSAVAVGSASAVAPEYGRCVAVAKIGKTYDGTYTDKGCTKEATAKEKTEGKKNKYNWLPGGVKLKQTSTGGKAVLQGAVDSRLWEKVTTLTSRPGWPILARYISKNSFLHRHC